MDSTNQIVESGSVAESTPKGNPVSTDISLEPDTSKMSNITIEEEVAAALSLSEEKPSVQDVPLENIDSTQIAVTEQPEKNSDLPLFEASETAPPLFDAAETVPPVPTMRDYAQTGPQIPEEVDLGAAPQPEIYNYYGEEEDDRPTNSWQNVLPLDKIKNGLKVAGEMIEPVVHKTGEKLTEAGQRIQETEFAQKTAQKVQEIHNSERARDIREKVSGFVKEADERTKPAREQAAADLALLGYTAKEKAQEAYVDAKPKLEEFGKTASQKFRQGASFLGAQFQNLQENIAKKNNQSRNNGPNNPPHVV
mmetsp:Transcript_19818/g.24977  ORF Transcript_19818/g.24977 Transcript_19818/m.24977 type:complete len:308 (+) Transcript_19818:58-981(+)